MHRQDEELEVHVLYERLMGDGRIYDVRAEYVICLGRQEAKSTWQMTFENKEPGLSIKEAQFPCINGVYWEAAGKTIQWSIPIMRGFS
ncbi:MAG: hypothetical protein ACLR23_28990 [Clostridia bacterium]